MRRAIAAILGVLGWMGPAPLTAISAPRLVADLAVVPSPQEGSAPAEFVRLGTQVLFTAQPHDHARTLFRSDGTASGTEELAAGCGSLAGGGFALRFATASTAYYSLRCEGAGEALWLSDGTPTGTAEVLAAGGYHSPRSDLGDATAVEDGAASYFLQGGNYDIPVELWRTDGTASGTARVAIVGTTYSASAALYRPDAGELLVLVAETFGSISVWKSDGTTAGTLPARTLDFPDQYAYLSGVAATATGIAFTVSVWPPSRVELWYSDGTPDGTVLGVELPFSSLDSLVEHAGAIYFTVEEAGESWIWRGDGTAASTRAIVPLGARHVRPSSFEVFDDRLYFVGCAADRSSCDLLRAPLTGGAPEEIAEVCDAEYCDEGGAELWVRGVGERLLFTRENDTEVTVWASSPDGGGQTKVAPLCATDTCFGTDAGPVVLEGRAFFVPSSAGRETHELWTSDGTAGGTIRLAGPLPVVQWFATRSAPLPLAEIPTGGGWVFAAGDTLHGLELWRAGPQADAAALVADLRLDRPGLSGAESVAMVDGEFIFGLADDSGNERTLYRREVGGSGAEPFLTVPIRHGRHGARNLPPTLREAADAWFFIESDAGLENPFAQQIWRYDPVSRDVRTLFAADPQVTGIGARADDLLPSGADFLFLGSIDPELHPAIYRLRPRSGAISKLIDLPATWATSIGRSGRYWFLLEDAQRVVAIDLENRTRKVIDDLPGAYIDPALALDQGVLFAVRWDVFTGSDLVELRQSSGNAAGSLRVGEWSPSGGGCGWYVALPPKGSASPALFAVQTYCTAAQSELWTSDGSVERTRSVRSFPQDHLDFAPLANRLRGTFLFLASRAEDAQVDPRFTIWKSDGTAAGTQEVEALPDDGHPSAPDFTEGALGAEAFYFVWSDAGHGRELWQTDGTPAGTHIAADIEPGPESSSPWQFRTVGDQVLFSAGAAASGLELWQIDGGSAAPELVTDLYPGIESSAPVMLGSSDEALYFLADDGVVGREIWEVDRPSVAPCVADATTLCLANGRFRARAVRRDFAGEMGAAGVVPLTGDSGYFWFFAPGNPEVLLKVVDACGLPGFENFWAYSTGLTNVEVELEVVDTLSGARRLVRTALGETYGPLYDSGSFQVCAFGGTAGAGAGASAPAANLPSSTVLPLLGGRFQAVATWAKRDGTTGTATAVPLAGDSGYFWFFAPSIVEVLVKMVDACGFDGFDNFWVFAGGLTDVEVHLAVTDTWTGEVIRHDSLQGTPFPTLLETGKLRVCTAAP